MLLRFGRTSLLSLLLIPASAWAQAADGATAPGAAKDVPAATTAKTAVNPKDGLTYVWIPAGSFQMGCSEGDTVCGTSEKSSHPVTLTKGFWIGQTPVTQDAYKKVIGSNPSHYVGDKLPVSQVSWNDAKAYCEKAGARLPTEAEWEYAARGGSPKATYGPINDIAWYAKNSGESIDEVGKKTPNGYGLYDTLGDVFEWVADWYAPFDAASATDPKGPASGENKAYRGAGWTSLALGVRVSYRDRALPSEDFAYAPRHAIGIRCATDNLETPAK